MPSDSTPLSERAAASIQRLSVVATDLNKASDQLGQAIAAIDTVLQTLNIGVPTWTTIKSGDDLPSGSDYYWSRDLGYAKVANRWGISLRTVFGSYSNPDEESLECWLFNDAPRWLRILGVAKIPDLLEALIKSTEETTKKIRNKTAEANQLATAIAQAAGKKPPTVTVADAMTNADVVLDAERSVLGAILLDNQALITALEEGLEPVDFTLERHQLIFRQMIELAETPQAIDLVTLSDKLHRKGDLDAAGGSAYIAQLVDGVPRVTHVEHYARIVKEKALPRDLIPSPLATVATEAMNDAASTGPVAKATLAEIAKKSARRGK